MIVTFRLRIYNSKVVSNNNTEFMGFCCVYKIYNTYIYFFLLFYKFHKAALFSVFLDKKKPPQSKSLLSKDNAVSQPPPPPPPVQSEVIAPTEGKTALLSSINSFQKKGLKKATTVDHSAPKI